MTGPCPAPAQWPGGTLVGASCPPAPWAPAGMRVPVLGQGWLRALGFGFQHGASSLSS